jgi:hypothetical protein
MIAVVGVVSGSITRGAWLQRAIVPQRSTGDHQPLCGSGAFALHPRLHSTLDHLDGYRTLLTVSYRQSPPGSRIERLAPRRHRLPGWLWTTTTALIRGWQRFEVTYRGGTGHAHKKYTVRLSAEERGVCQEIVKRLKGTSEKVKRAQMLLKADADGPEWSDIKIAEVYDCRVQTVETVRKRLVTEGFEVALERKKRSTAPTPHKLDGIAEAKLIAMR